MRAIAGLSASALVRRPDDAIRGFIGGMQFALPPRSLTMRRVRACEHPIHDVRSARRHRPREFVLTIRHDGLDREALVYLPPRASRVLFNFHGFTSDALEQAEYTQMNHVAGRHGFAVVHPQGVHGLLGYRAWNAGPFFARAMSRAVDDVGFVAALMDELASLIRVREWFATGISNGGMLAYRLAHVLPRRFRAIAPVAAVDLTEDAVPRQTLGILHIHGVHDGLVPYHERAFRVASLVGGFGWKHSARQSLLRFARARQSEIVEVEHGRWCEVWRGRRAVAKLLVHRGGHTWLGDGFKIERRNAAAVARGSLEIVRFFLEHSMVT